MSIVKEDGLLSTPRRVLITGGAGFIGGHLSNRLLGLGHSVAVIDSMLPYYDVSVKRKRIQQLEKQYGEKFQFIESSAGDLTTLDQLFASFRPQVVVHLAAQAGVRYCEEFKEEAHANNVETTERLLKKALLNYDEDLLHFVSASSSSVYGCLPRPWHEGLEPAPEGVYANTKKRGEQLCREYAARRTEEKKERAGVAVACLRFFTVYGPEGRPDMAPGKFMDLIHRGKPIPIFGDGSALRDFTFIDDIIQGIVRVIDRPRPFEIYNLGRGSTIPHSVLDLIKAIETSLGKKALTNFLPPQPGDVPATQADISKARSLLDYEPSFPLSEGIAANARWFLANIPKLFVAVALSPSVSSNILSLSPLPDVLVNFPESISGQDSQPSAPLSLRTEDGQALSIAGAAQFLQAQLKTQSLTSVAYGIKDDANIFVVFVQDKDDWKSKDVIQKVAERISDNGSEVIVWSVQRASAEEVVSVPEINGLSVEGDSLATFVAEKPEAITTANCVIRLDVLSSILSELKAPEDVPANTLLSNIVSHALSNTQFYRVSTLPNLLSSSSL